MSFNPLFLSVCSVLPTRITKDNIKARLTLVKKWHLLLLCTSSLFTIDLAVHRYPIEAQTRNVHVVHNLNGMLQLENLTPIERKIPIRNFKVNLNSHNGLNDFSPISQRDFPTISFQQPLHCVPYVPCSYPDRVDLRIIVIVYYRMESMLKLLRSLDTLVLDGASAAMEIWIDRNKHNQVHVPTLKAAQQFHWTKGATRVHVQNRHMGIQGQWIDTWQPDDTTDELALILEDDISVSPYAWRWLRAAHQRFGSRTDILGYTLQSKHVDTAIRNGDGKHLLKAMPSQNVFLNRQMGSWGFSPHPAVWADFQRWYHTVRKDPTFKPYVGGGVIFDQWYKEFEKKGTTDSMWTIWFIKYTNERNMYCVYNNLVKYRRNMQSMLAVHRGEKGLHSKRLSKSNSSKEYNLLTTWADFYVQFPKKVQRFEFNANVSLVEI